jgi:hypothetical protein
MPNYLQRVVMSGARTRPSARPPLLIGPSLPALGPPAPLAGEAVDVPEPSGRGVDSSQRSASEELSWPGRAPVAFVGPIDPPRPAEWVPDQLGTLPAPPPRADAETVAHPEELGWSDAPTGPVIRAPRGLRPAARATAEAPPAARENTAPAAGAQALPRPADVSARPGSSAPARAPHLPHGKGTPRFRRSDDREATRGAEAGENSRTDEIERGRPRRRDAAPESAHRAPATAPEARGLLATPSATPAPVAPGVRERESRLTIGRIDVEVHNELPAPPPTAGRVAPSGLGGRLASRFLLKP